jgi:hypothetical protein
MGAGQSAGQFKVHINFIDLRGSVVILMFLDVQSG